MIRLSLPCAAAFLIVVAFTVAAPRLRPGGQPPPCDKPCAADSAWFPATPKPNFQKPNPDLDCDFYRPAWQYLLYLIQEETPGSGPRLLALDHPDNVFGRPAVSRFPEAKKGTLRLAPRVALSRDPLSGAEINQASSRGILVDPTTRRAVYYGVHFNEVFSKFLFDNGYNNVLSLANAPPDQEFPRGSAEIKTAWRILPPGDQGDGYLTVSATVSQLRTVGDAIVIDPTATEDRAVALLGIHVVFVLDGHPEFIWATFEHNNNAPELNQMRVEKPPGADPNAAVPVDPAKGWSLYRKGKKANECNQNNKGKNMILAADQTLTPVTDVFRQFHFGNDDEPCTIETLNRSVSDQITASLPQVKNEDARKRLAAMKNYSLRGAMWLNNPAYFREGVDFALLDEQDGNKKILGGDLQLSNAVIETFTQHWAAGTAQGRNSTFCFDCHRTMPQTLPGTAITLRALRLNVSQTLVQRYLHAAEAAKK